MGRKTFRKIKKLAIGIKFVLIINSCCNERQSKWVLAISRYVPLSRQNLSAVFQPSKSTKKINHQPSMVVEPAKNGHWRNRECKNSLWNDLPFLYSIRYNRIIEFKAV